jgi:eukaryotic-like serine/threonine-protein kinase
VDAVARLNAALAGRYQVERELGRGGMATVYLAHDIQHQRPVALKVLRPELSAMLGPDRFLQEIRTAARLQHPHILPLFDSGNAGGLLWYSMPYVEGESLRDRLRREKQLPVGDVIRLAGQVLSALEYAHKHGVVHRDIKPENILLMGDQAVIADLGIARAIGGAGGERLTETGLAVGTPAYMSPEQAAGERDVDGRTDVYSLGAVLYEAIAGEPPFTGPTAQAIIARRMTETPRPLHTTRDSVPQAVEQSIMTALARAPADRHGSAAAFSAALERTGKVQPIVPAPRRSQRRRLAAAVSVIIAAILVAGVLRSRSRAPAALDTSLVAIAPFDVLDPKLEVWREGMVDLLSRNLDGAGPLRTVSPTVVVRRWSGRGDSESARTLGQRTGAGLALYGSLVSAGRDSVRMSVTLLDVGRGRPVEEWELRDVADRIDRLSDSLTIRVLQGISRERPIGSVRLPGYGSRSLPTIKAFLQGEQHLRRSDWDSALVYYQRAIDLDSTFAPALRRASTALGWIRTGHDSLSNAYALRAGIHNHGLPVRDSLLLTVDSLFASLLDTGPMAVRADSLWGVRLHRLFAILEDLRKRYPQDPEVWHLQGEADNHLGPFADRTIQDQLDAFDRAIVLDSAFAPSYIHPIEVASRNGGEEGARRYLTPFLKLAHSEKNADGARLLETLLDSTPSEAERLRLYAEMQGNGLFSTYIALSSLPDSGELVVGVSRYIAAHLLPGPPFNEPANAKRSFARALMSRGHLRAGLEQLPEQDQGPLLFEAALLGAVPVERAARRFQEWMALPSVVPVMAFPWWTTQGDSVSLRVAERKADSLARQSPSPIARSQARYASLSAAAYRELAAKDTAGALQRFMALPRDLCPSCFLDRLTLAQLLVERRQDQEAMRILRADHPAFTLSPTPTAILWTLLRGRVAERLNQREQAIQSYAWVAGMWRKPDSELQPYVNEAREGLTRLTAEQR